MKALRIVGVLSLFAARVQADVVVLREGDRISGQILVRGTKRLRLQTPFGLLVIPLEKIDKIRKDDGTEEVLNAPPVSPTPPPPPPAIPLVLDVGGNTFWQAWDPKTPPLDPSLRFVVRVDDKVVASFVDSTLDPGDLPKAVVNTFAFSPETLKLRPAPGVLLRPPEVKDGRVRLAIELPGGWEGMRRVRVTYQANEGTEAKPQWRDLVTSETTVDLRPTPGPALRVEQARGTMEFSRKQMRNVDSFQVALHAE